MWWGTDKGPVFPWLFGAASRFDGAADCTVVSVVVRDLNDGSLEVKVLPSPPPMPLVLSAPPAVATVPALECAVSECTVSGLVDTVGAADLVLMVGACWPSRETGREDLLWEGDA